MQKYFDSTRISGETKGVTDTLKTDSKKKQLKIVESSGNLINNETVDPVALLFNNNKITNLHHKVS